MLPLKNRIADQMNLTGDLVALLRYDETVLDNFSVPEPIERDLAIDYLMMQAGDRPLLHPDPRYMKHAIHVWCRKMAPIWDKLYKTTTVEYNPIHNYDRTEEWEETRESTRDRTADTTSTESQSRGDNETITDAGSVKHDVSAENVSSYQPDYQDVTDTTNTRDATMDLDIDGEINLDENEKVKEGNTHKLRAYGNIGVTTTQEMLESERRVVQYSIYKQIVDDFIDEFCLLIW